MIIYNPLDGDAFTSAIPSKPRHCFLMTRLGRPIHNEVVAIRRAIVEVCEQLSYRVVDATSHVTGRDFLLKIWRLIASTPLSVGICHESIPVKTQENIYYELGVAQALGKETLIVKSRRAEIPSDFVRTEYVVFDSRFAITFRKYLESIMEQAEHYEAVADQLDRDPILAINYLKRAYLITGNQHLRGRAEDLLDGAGLETRAMNCVERLAASF